MGTAILAIRWSRLSVRWMPMRRVRDHCRLSDAAWKNEVDRADV